MKYVIFIVLCLIALRGEQPHDLYPKVVRYPQNRYAVSPTSVHAKGQIFLDNTQETPTLTKATNEILDTLQNLRAGRLHMQHLELDDREHETAALNEITAFLGQSHHAPFSSDEEITRLKIIDYLGEKLLGRIPTSAYARCQALAESHINFDILQSTLDWRQKKSVLGDQVELIQYLTRADRQYAEKLLKSYEKSPRYVYFAKGFKNGLWMRGESFDKSH